MNFKNSLNPCFRLSIRLTYRESLRAMAESNVKPFDRDLMWEAVRNFGQSAWNDNAAAKQAGKPRIIPTAYMNIPPLVTWPDYQTKLMMQGVTPIPTPPTPPVYCTAGTSATLPSP